MTRPHPLSSTFDFLLSPFSCRAAARGLYPHIAVVSLPYRSMTIF